MSITAYKDHPLSELLPLMDEVEIAEMAGDIQQHGQRAPITLYENKILDGRNRYRACKIANVEPKVRHFTSGDALSFIVSANVFRRHLTTSQRAVVAAKLANLSNGRKTTSSTTSAILPRSKPVTQSEAARELKVSERTVRTAREVIREAPQKEVEAIERGEKTVATVARETRAIKAETKATEKHYDKTGYPIPDEVYSDWREAEGIRSTLNDLQKIKLYVEKAIDKKELIFREVTSTTVATLKNAWTELQQVLPYAVCPTCQGLTRKSCTVCKKRGFVSKFGYEHWFPKETIALREKAIKK